MNIDDDNIPPSTDNTLNTVKKTKPHRKAVQFTPSVIEFIVDKMAEGYDISNICKKWPDKVPHYKAILRKSLKDPEFAEIINSAYTVLLYKRIDELTELAKTPARQLYPELDDWREASETKRSVMDAAKFVLGKMAPMLSNRFDKASKVEVTGQIDSTPQIVFMNYAQQTDLLEQIVKDES